jgi:hypothetical protein
MPSWGDISNEIATTPPATLAGANPFDYVRRKYLATVHSLTKRAVIVYASRWTTTNPGLPIPPSMLAISSGDIHGFMEALHGIHETQLDLIVHSPGGSAEAAEAIVLYLRGKFRHIRVFVPHMAMSAATMIACAADEIVMGMHSFIGPIDPQLQLQTGLGLRSVAAQAIIDQFDRAVLECQDPAKIRAWFPMLAQYGPDLLVTCQNANALSKDLVTTWLKDYMFMSDPDATGKANAIADWMADHNTFKSHGRTISRDQARGKGMIVTDLEADQALQDAILSVYHAVSLTFSGGIVVKLVENHLGKAFMDNIIPPAPQIAFPFPMRPHNPGAPMAPPPTP